MSVALLDQGEIVPGRGITTTIDACVPASAGALSMRGPYFSSASSTARSEAASSRRNCTK
jgi:hypothetical protein